MTIQATVQPRQILWNLVYAILCGGLALWGAWDYWVTIPRAERNFERYTAASEEYQSLTEASRLRSLEDEERQRFIAAEEVVNEFKNDPPVKPAAYDRAVQLWLYMIGCGVLGTPAFLWNLVAMPRTARRYRLDEDGSLHTPAGTFAAGEIASIDMTKWMAKSIATVTATDGRSVKLDDYKFRNIHLIVGALATRFHPEEWTSEARLKDPPAEQGTESGGAAAMAATPQDP